MSSLDASGQGIAHGAAGGGGALDVGVAGALLAAGLYVPGGAGSTRGGPAGSLVLRAAKATITGLGAAGGRETDGTVAGVSFYNDINHNGVADSGELLAVDSDGSNGYSLTLGVSDRTNVNSGQTNNYNQNSIGFCLQIGN